MTTLSLIARRTILAAGTALVAASATSSVFAASTAAWPTKPVRIVVGFPGGSSPDLTARTFSEPLSKLQGQPVIVENKVGAGGNIGATEVARARQPYDWFDDQWQYDDCQNPQPCHAL